MVTKVNLSSGDGEIDHGTLEIPIDLLNSKRSDRLVITTRDDSTTIELGHGVTIHIFRSEG